MGLFDRFRKWRPAAPKQHPIDKPLIGSEMFAGRPLSPREAVMPARKRIQAEYAAEGRDPDSLERDKFLPRDEQFWMTYVDSLLVFERYNEALTYLNVLTCEFPGNASFRKMKALIVSRLAMRDE